MMNAPSILPRFREDLEITPRIEEGGGLGYLVKDIYSDEVYQLGEEDYFLCRQFDGQTQLDSVQGTFQERFGIPIKLDQLEAFVRQLARLGLVVSEGEELELVREAADQVEIHRIFNPDRVIGLLGASLGWCFSTVFLICAGVMVFLGIGTAIKFGSDFFYDMVYVWEVTSFIMVPIFGIFIVDPLREITKAVGCKHYGGHVYEFGVSFLYRIIPRFYFDISDAWWFMEKGVRRRVLAAGLVCQVLLWAVSIIAWKNTALGTNVHNFWAILTLASFVFFLLNLLPLLPRDGYHLLSTWLEEPDLWNRSRELAKSWVLRRPLPEPLTSREISRFKWYGSLSVGYQYIITASIMGLFGYNLITNMKGVGAFMFITILWLRFENFLRKQFTKISVRLPFLANQSGGIKLRWLIRICVLGVIILILFIPYPFDAGGEFRLLPADQVGIRAQVSGEIESVLVKEGQWVKEGQAVAVLVGRDQRKKVEELEATLRDFRARLQLLRQGPKPEAVELAKQEVTTAAKSLEYSTLQAKRYKDMFRKKAVTEEEYEATLKMRDLDRERLELARRNLELVKSGARDEEIEALEAEVNRLEVTLAHAQEELRLTTLRSLAEGRIITPYLSQTVGQYLAVGELFAVVEDARKVIVEIEVPQEDISEVEIGAKVKLKTWAHPGTFYRGEVTAVAPVAYEKSIKRLRRVLSDRESRFEQREILREKGKVVRVLCKLSDADESLRTDMTGYAKIRSEWRPVAVAFTRWLVRFIMVEVWSWIP